MDVPGHILGNTMLAAGFGLIIMGLLLPVAWALYVGSLTEFTSAGPSLGMLRDGLLVFYVIGVIAPAMAGLGFLAAGWSIRGVSAAEHHIKDAGASIAEFAQAERERAQRFERLYGEMHEQVETLREFFQRAYVMVPGPGSSMVKAPVSIAPSRIVDNEDLSPLIPPTIPLTAMEFMSNRERETLLSAGIQTVQALAIADPHELAERTGLPEGNLYRCVRAARLFALEHIPPRDICCLVTAGVTSVADLASREAESLQRAMEATPSMEECPTELEIDDLISAAKRLVAQSEARAGVHERPPRAARLESPRQGG